MQSLLSYRTVATDHSYVLQETLDIRVTDATEQTGPVTSLNHVTSTTDADLCTSYRSGLNIEGERASTYRILYMVYYLEVGDKAS